MPKILSLLFLLADYDLLSAIFHWGQQCGLVILVSLSVAAVGDALRRRARH